MGLYALLAFDGGARASRKPSAHASCVWSNSGKLLWWTASAVHPCATNNETEAMGLLTGLRWLLRHYRSVPIHVIGDSAIIINMASATYRVSANNLRPVIRDIRDLLPLFRQVTLQAVPRVYNVAADGLCNWIMDMQLSPITTLRKSADDTA
ncbi:hypothetical protein F441_19182 [Phytophthora nicotianae CJ01A1]|uniref:RNase H type-1 domain-containing protein n=4 Tax=Phytophthora nicotianae TaxID=4792 RepID=W2K7D0_PHYNI|nr:hypothetical protein L915_18783 [Phytophthora nicotianae]ETL27847.1 hypothetical protein L916_18681 [Phytophthora nicotianae]ETL81091.1 hypothetical protein L917_18507 [Phytophthora nicotianae]ETP03946.1 hypothetical protein F441_19182 [Phytophthora nicotianae CJ01A1]